MKSWWNKVRRRLAVARQWRGPGDALSFLGVFCFAAAVPALLRLRLQRLEALLEPRRAAGPPNPLRAERALACVNSVLSAGRPLVRGGCLTRGLTRYYFLRRAGLPVSLCFGVGTVRGKFEGHCWLTKEGEPFLESRDPRQVFTTIYTMPSAGRAHPERAGV
jgi:hypothetical protein